MDQPLPPPPAVYEAISQVTRAIGATGIAKDRKNTQQGYAFRGIDDMLNHLNPLLAEAHLVIIPRMVAREHEERATRTGGVMHYVTVAGEFDFISTRDASRHTARMFGEGMDTADKATNKAMSAAYKYAVIQVFAIPTTGVIEDADALTPEPSLPVRRDGQPTAEQQEAMEAIAADVYRLLQAEGPNTAFAHLRTRQEKASDGERRYLWWLLGQPEYKGAQAAIREVAEQKGQ